MLFTVFPTYALSQALPTYNAHTSCQQFCKRCAAATTAGGMHTPLVHRLSPRSCLALQEEAILIHHEGRLQQHGAEETT